MTETTQTNSPSTSPALDLGGTSAPILTRGQEAGDFIGPIKHKRGYVDPKTGKVFVRYGIRYPGRAYWCPPDRFSHLVTKIASYRSRYHDNHKDHLQAVAREYTKRYYRHNKPVVREAQKAFRKTNASRIKESKKAFWHRHKEAIYRSQRRWSADNKPKVLAYAAKSRKKYRDKRRAWHRAHAKKYPHLGREANARRRARKRGQMPADASKVFIASFYETASRISRCVGIKFHVDHVKPISRGGQHHENNLQIIPAGINLSKGCKWEEN